MGARDSGLGTIAPLQHVLEQRRIVSGGAQAQAARVRKRLESLPVSVAQR